MYTHFVFRGVRKLLRKNPYTDVYVQYSDQQANDYILDAINNAQSGLMISKFGTIELDNLICADINAKGISIKDYINALRGEYSIHIEEAFEKLCNNAGFFPKNYSLIPRYIKLVKIDMKEINILGSYMKAEKYIAAELSKNCVKVNLNGYYAPFLWNFPWTQALKDKNVLVIHPFIESIKKQYEKRDLLFKDKNVLPQFKQLYLIKAVQSIAGNGKNTGFSDWFEALQSMKNQMDMYDYDVLIVGCGAYGMHLAAHAKRKGKIAVHLAGWTQMLFGIYGERWIKDQPEYAKFINENWVRPEINEKPLGADSVEGGCYW